jgi:hypothetical protein
MQTKNAIIITLTVTTICLATLCYSLWAHPRFVDEGQIPVTVSPTPTIEPTPTTNPTSASPKPTTDPLTLIPKPTTPEFSISLANSSYDIPAKYKIDEFSGQEVLTQAAQHYQNQSIQITIKNQPFTPFKTNGFEINLYYNVSWKGHYGDAWRSSEFNYRASSTDSTIIAITPSTDYLGYINNEPAWIGEVPDGAYDFRVQAFIGYWVQESDFKPPYLSVNYYEVWTGQTSDWSSIQTITIP